MAGFSLMFKSEQLDAARVEAEKWCAERGISVGRLQHGAPRGLLIGDYDIQKWRNLSARDIEVLDGTMHGDMRNGPVYVVLKAPPPPPLAQQGKV